MNEEKTEELITYLADLEFKGERLEQEIRKNMVHGFPFFSVPYRKDYGDEQMFFNLNFHKDKQFDAYRLEGYKATYRKPIHIEYAVINGVDTGELEERMKKVDWIAHFTGNDKYPENPEDKDVKQIISDLLALDANHNNKGIKIQELLQLKYFPEEVYDNRLKELRFNYELNGDFTATDDGLCNAHLAYHSVSGRLDDLYEKLQYLELEQYPGVDIYKKLETFLSGNPDDFEIKCFRNEPEGYAEYFLPVTKIDGWYSADTYTVTLAPYPPIEHGRFNDMDTQELEAMMQQIDWHNDRELFVLHEEAEPELLPVVEDIISQINKLNQDPKGALIAQQLQLKYWADASFLDSLIEQKTWDYLDSLPKRVQQFPVEIKAKTAYNLLCGRAAKNFPALHTTNTQESWMRLDLSHKDEKGNYPINIIGGFPTSELEKRLDLLPIDNMDFYSIRNALERGDLLPVMLRDDRKVMLQANPEQNTIHIYTSDIRPIYVNLTLDPDWRPFISQADKAQEIIQKTGQSEEQNHFFRVNKRHPRKGRRM